MTVSSALCEHMAQLGGASRKDDLFFAKVDTQESSVRFKMEGLLRGDELQQEAFQASTTSALAQKEKLRGRNGCIR